MDVTNILGLYEWIPGSIIRLFLPYVFIIYGIMRATNVAMPNIEPKQSSFLNLCNKEKAPAQIRATTEGYIGTAGIMWKALFDQSHGLAFIQALLALTIGIKMALRAKDEVQEIHVGLLWGKLLHQKIYLLGQYIKHMQHIHRFIQKHPEINKNLTTYKHLNDFFINQDQHTKQLLKIITSPTFSTPYNNHTDLIFNRFGKVLVAYKLLLEKSVQQKLSQALACMAELDAFTSIAKLLKEYEQKRVHYCFATYLENKTPLIQLNEYWNPFIDANIAKTNTTNLGIDVGVPNIIITGPNSAGKSTILKSIALALIMAQSLGIAPATSMQCTPFHFLATYMDITDDIADKTSLFQAEVDRAVKLETRIKSMTPNQFSFVMFDELFSGTSPDEGANIAYASAAEIGNNPQNMCLIATHYQLLTTLADNTPYYKNFCVPVIEHKDKPVERLYALKPGISTQHIALSIAQERGCKGVIIEQAKKRLDENH
jgi:hypothetical protein